MRNRYQWSKDTNGQKIPMVKRMVNLMVFITKNELSRLDKCVCILLCVNALDKSISSLSSYG